MASQFLPLPGLKLLLSYQTWIFFYRKKPKHKKDTFNDNIGNQGKKKYMGTLTIFNVNFLMSSKD